MAKRNTFLEAHTLTHLNTYMLTLITKLKKFTEVILTTKMNMDMFKLMIKRKFTVVIPTTKMNMFKLMTKRKSMVAIPATKMNMSKLMTKRKFMVDIPTTKMNTLLK